ncbi:hypothetical protein [Iodidimonas nitroreducens]|nr:hypothetical protein [Iodidimonas nitroreducens]
MARVDPGPAGSRFAHIGSLLHRAFLKRRMGRWAVLFLLGAISSFAFAPFYILPVLWISFPLFLLIVMGADRGRGAFIDGWFFGFGAFAIGLRWIVQSFANQPSVPDAMGPRRFCFWRRFWPFIRPWRPRSVGGLPLKARWVWCFLPSFLS